MKQSRKHSIDDPPIDDLEDFDELEDIDEMDDAEDDPVEVVGPIAGNKATLAADASWVYLHLDHPRVQRSDAVTAGRWNLLVWGQDERSRFYRTVLTKAMATMADPGKLPGWADARAWDGIDDADDDVDLDDPDAIVDEFETTESDDCFFARGAPQQIMDAAGTMVAEWAKEHSIELSPEGRLAITRRMAGIVDDCALAALDNPKKFGDLAAPTT